MALNCPDMRTSMRRVIKTRLHFEEL